MPSTDKPPVKFWTKSIIALVIVNVVFLLTIGAGLIMIVPALISGFHDYANKQP